MLQLYKCQLFKHICACFPHLDQTDAIFFPFFLSVFIRTEELNVPFISPTLGFLGFSKRFLLLFHLCLSSTLSFICLALLFSAVLSFNPAIFVALSSLYLLKNMSGNPDPIKEIQEMNTNVLLVDVC